MTQAEIKQDTFPIMLRDGLEAQREEIAEIFGNKRVTQRFITIALTAATKNEKLRQCSMKSIFLAVMESAHVGLMPDGLEAALIPYKDIATFTPMARGITRLMLRSPGVLKVEARVVYEGDHFEFQYGTRPDIDHVPLKDGKANRAITHAYAIAWRQGTNPTPEVAGIDEIELARDQSKAPNGPHWTKWFGETSRKVPLKRLGKYIDLSPEATRAIELDHLATDSSFDRDYIDGVSEEYVSQLVKSHTIASIADLKERMVDEGDSDLPDNGKDEPDPEPIEDPPDPEQPTLNLNDGEAMTPAQVKDFIRVRLDMHKGKRTHPDLIKNVAWQLGECFTGMDDPDAERHRVMYFLFKAESTKDLTGAELQATLDWLRSKKGHDEKWHPNALAAQEARAIAQTFEESE